MLTLDEEDYEALGWGDPWQVLLWSGWAEYELAARKQYDRGRDRSAYMREWLKTPKGRATKAAILRRRRQERHPQTVRQRKNVMKRKAARDSAARKATRAALQLPKRITEDEVALIIMMYQAAQSVRSICLATGRPRATVRRALVNAGLWVPNRPAINSPKSRQSLPPTKAK
jgi:hypothetical protein